MRILFDDVIQRSDAPDLLKSPSLADIYEFTSETFTLDRPERINCIGIGNTDATELTISGFAKSDGIATFDEAAFDSASEPPTINAVVNLTDYALDDPYPYANYKNGLYILPTELYTNSITISHNGTYIGRLSAGYCPRLKASKSREPGFVSTHQNRETLSGQTIPGAGGISRRRMDVDFRYQFDEVIFNQIKIAHPTQIAKGYPLFICFEDCELNIFPYNRLYGKTKTDLLFQTSVRKYLHSIKLSFLEAF